VLDRLRTELDETTAELRAHMASWEYAFAMGSSCHGATDHPTHRATRERTEHLHARLRDLRARIAEFDLTAG
jgi:hypothetical protein